MTDEMKQWRDALYNASVEAIDRGWCVVPLSIEGKKPLIRWKEFQTNPTTQEQLDDWFDNGVTTESGNTVSIFNMALVTGAVSGIIVLDCDNEKAVQFALKNEMVSPFVVTTARGKHFYFAHPLNGQRFANKVGNTARDWYPVEGLDLRGDGGYVVMPPSMKVKEGKAEHIYHMEVGYGLSLDDIPDFPWKGEPSDTDPLIEGEFTFGNLSLANVKLPNAEQTLPVVDQVKRRVAHLGRKLREGDATDLWMLKYIGQKVRQGVAGDDLHKMVWNFHDEFFDSQKFTERETREWLETKIRSVVDMDKRQYPSDYDENGQRIQKTEEKISLGRLKPIRSSDIDRLIDTLGETAYWADPVIPAETITQVVGYNGHGKSFFLQGMLVSMASGREEFGPFHGKPAKILYLDYDNPSRTVLYRFKNFVKMFGDCGDNFNVWSPSLISSEDGGEMNLGSEAGFKLLGDWLEVIQPNIVVIDTVRNAFGGLEEANAAEWFKVNFVAKSIRTKFKASVVLVHHRNKPGEGGLGREAGSTAQLTDIDTQLMITTVYRDKAMAKNKAGLLDTDLRVTNFDGKEFSPTTYLEERLEPDSRIRMVQQISFGKTRQQTELHRTYYVGWADRLADGSQYMVHTPSPKQQAIWLHINKRMSVEDISRKLMIPMYEVKQWIPT